MIYVDTSCVTGKGGGKEYRKKLPGPGLFSPKKMMGFSKFGLFSVAKCDFSGPWSRLHNFPFFGMVE